MTAFEGGRTSSLSHRLSTGPQSKVQTGLNQSVLAWWALSSPSLALKADVPYGLVFIA